MSAPWLVLGAGALGTALVYLMEREGVDCVLLSRDGSNRRVAVPREARSASGPSRVQGEDLILPTQTLTEQAAASIERLLITTKAGQIEEALKYAAPYLTSTAIAVTTANGLGFPQSFSSRAQPLRLERAVTTAGAFRDANGRVHLVAEGTTRIGVPGETVAPVWFADSLARLPGWTWIESIAKAVDEKFAVNCVINPLSARYRCRNGELLRGGHPGPALTALCRETDAALRTLGLWHRDASLASVAAEVCRQTATNRSSMLQDVLAGRETELPFLTGELLRRGQEKGLQLPINAELYRALLQAPHLRSTF